MSDPTPLPNLHLTWLGGPAPWRRIQSLEMVGTIKTSGLEGSFRATLTRDGCLRTELDLGVVKTTEVIRGDEGFELNMSGQLEPMDEGKRRRTQRQSERIFQADLESDDWIVLGEEEKDGTTWTVLRREHDDGDQLDLFLDPDTGACTWTRRLEDTTVSWERNDDWRSVGDVRIPFRQETHYPETPEGNSTIEFETIRLDVDPPDETFAPPTPAKQASFGEPTWIDFDLHRKRHACLPARLDGHEAAALLDSGAGLTVLDKAFAAEHGIEGDGEITAMGVGGPSQATLVNDLALELGSLRLTGVTAAIMDLADIQRRLGRTLHVVVGKEVFQSAVVEIDYPSDRMRFHDPEGYRHDDDATTVPLIPSVDGLRQVELQVEDLPPARVHVDTGSGANLDLFATFVDEHDLKKGRTVSTALSAGVGGDLESGVGTLRSLTFAGHRIEDVPIGFASATLGAFHTKELAGNMGTGLFRRFALTFDYSRDELHVRPGPDWDAPFERDRLGLNLLLQDDGALEVLHVAKGSPAETQGWSRGDRVTAIDGQAVEADTWQQQHDEAKRQPAGTEVSLTLADGQERTLVLNDYY
ncbi:MAG: aspartyl protease family protein [Acidobacteriota bacterium]